MKYDMPFTKEYFEEYARLLLNDTFNLNLIHRQERYNEDRPDLISLDEKIGVEVTNALNELSGRQNKLFQQIYPIENRKAIIIKEAERLGIKENLHFSEDVAYLSEDYISADKIKILADRINTKLDKLNSTEFHKYKFNALFVNAFDYFQDDITKFLENYQNYINNYPINYDYIFIFNCDGLFFVNNNEYTIKMYDETKLSSYKDKSLQYAKLILNKWQ